VRAWPLGLGSGVLLIVAMLLWLAPGDRPTHLRGRHATSRTNPLFFPGRVPPVDAGKKADIAPAPFASGSREATSAAFPWLHEAQLDDGRRFIRVDIAALNALQVGSRFDAEVAGTGGLRPALVEAEQRIDDVRRLTGSWWDVDGREYAFGLSLSSDGRYVAGSFDANQGQLVVEALDGAGWVENPGGTPARSDRRGRPPP